MRWARRNEFLDGPAPLALIPESLRSIEGLRVASPQTTAGGVYFLIADGICIYCGQSSSIAGRLLRHKTGPFECALYLPFVSEYDRIGYERIYIRLLNPPRNQVLIAYEERDRRNAIKA